MSHWVQEFVSFVADDFLKSDEFLAVMVPIVFYWIFSFIYMMLGNLERYRLHPKKDEDLKNLVSKREVLKGVLRHQAIQIVIVALVYKLTGSFNGAEQVAPAPSLMVLARQFLVATLVADTWNYFGHRYMHENKFLYRHVHSIHHRLYVPYAFGSVYNHPVDTLMDMVGAGLSMAVSGMSPRTSIYFFTFVVVKTVDDHCGMWLPGNIFQMLFWNNTAYHDSHHQLYGNKYNFAQPFFVTWDKICGTYLPYSVEKKEGGGYEVKPVKQD